MQTNKTEEKDKLQNNEPPKAKKDKPTVENNTFCT
jgi:hypothetical protein